MKRMKKLALLLSLTVSLLITGCSGAEERAWQSGQKALSEENYPAAVEAFEKAGSYQDAERLLQYAKASVYLENGDYTEAGTGFRQLGDYKDSLMMDTYCQAREQEAIAQAAFQSADTDLAVSSCMEACGLYSGLALFRDSDVRASDNRELLYTKATEWMNQGSFDAAASGFAALEDWQDSSRLQTYCRASALEQKSEYAEAAELFSQIPDVLDSNAREDAAREQAYQLAADLLESGDYTAASAAFAELGTYRDSENQRDSAVKLQIQVLLRTGSYAEALDCLSTLEDPGVFPEADPSANADLGMFLGGFVSTWMNAHAGVMNAFFSCNLLQPYLEPGGELDTLIRAELTDDGTPLNYNYIFLGYEVTDMRVLDEGFTVAEVQGTASYVGQGGYTEVEESLQVLIDSRQGNPLAAAVAET